MSARIARILVAGLLGALLLSPSAQAGGYRNANSCGGGRGFGHGPRGKYVTYNGVYFGTYPLYNAAPPAPTYVYPSGPFYAPPTPGIMATPTLNMGGT